MSWRVLLDLSILFAKVSRWPLSLGCVLVDRPQYFAEPTSIDELAALVARCKEEQVSVRLLGAGSNLLIPDEGVQGMVIQLAAPAFCQIRREGNQVIAGGGAKLGHVVATAVREGLAGLEQLVAIPGSVGGALHSNSGSAQSDVGQVTSAATVMTGKGEIRVRESDDLRFAYRKSSLDELAILEARFSLEDEDPSELMKRMQKRWIVKNASIPTTGQGIACLFKDPGGVSAASLIEGAGLKGVTMGEIQISDSDPNFVVVGAQTSSQDVVDVLQKISDAVLDQSGVELESSLEIW